MLHTYMYISIHLLPRTHLTFLVFIYYKRENFIRFQITDRLVKLTPMNLWTVQAIEQENGKLLDVLNLEEV